MAQLPETESPTIAAIRRHYEASAEDWRRNHLGASVIGDDCTRKLWYGFRWASAPGFDGRMLRLFERGKREEAWIIEDLKAAGFRVEFVDTSGNQYRFSALGGHFAGSVDGAILGVKEAPKTWHLLEVKTSNERRFRELKKSGVQIAQPKHYAQVQVYMHSLKLTRAFYVCVCKNDDHIYVERVRHDPVAADAFYVRAKSIIDAPEPLTKISEDPSYFVCRFCEFKPHCQDGEVASLERNCRTCLSSTAEPGGSWSCAYHKESLTPDKQRAGCDAHLFIPALLPWDAIGGFDTGSARGVKYKRADGSFAQDSGRALEEMPSDDK